jgi:hypothetical protein
MFTDAFTGIYTLGTGVHKQRSKNRYSNMRPIEKMLVTYGIINTSNKILCNVYPLNIL